MWELLEVSQPNRPPRPLTAQKLTKPQGLSVPTLTVSVQTRELERIWKESVASYSKYYPGIFLKGLWKNTKGRRAVAGVSASRPGIEATSS
jgi:hypothetical protein